MHIDAAGYPELDMSGSIMWVGEMGAGKTVGQKTFCSHIVEQGGQFWAVDKSADREWGRFAATFDSHIVVDATDPQWSMDPLRILPSAAGCTVARTFLVQLLNLDTQDTTGLLLGQVLQADYLDEHHIPSLAALTEHLLSGASGLDGGPGLGKRLKLWSQTPLARVIFDDTLPPADLTVSATAWCTTGMDQPTADELVHGHLFRQLPVEKIFGRAYYRLLTSLARLLCFADRSRPTVFQVDELYDFAQNPANVLDLQHFLRQGRRPKALLSAGTHDPGDTNDEVLTGLIPTRVLMRHRDTGLAESGLLWLGLSRTDPDFPTHLKRVREDMAPVLGDAGVPLDRRGECYVRDAFGKFGFAKVVPPADPLRRAAVLSTPPKSAVRK